MRDGGVDPPNGDGGVVSFVPCTSFGPATPIAELDTVDNEQGPSLTASGREIYFFRAAIADFRIFVARRTGLTEPFSPPELVTGFDVGADDQTPNLSPDGLTLYFASGRQPKLGGDYDIWSASRPALDAAWTAPVRVDGVSSAYTEGNATITADGLDIFFHAVGRPPGSGSNFALYHAVRATTSDPFDAQSVDLVQFDNYANDDALDPWISPDGLALYFIAGISAVPDLYVATRPDRSSSFHLIGAVGAGNAGSPALTPYVAPDGRTLYFSSYRSGNWDLYTAACVE